MSGKRQVGYLTPRTVLVQVIRPAVIAAALQAFLQSIAHATSSWSVPRLGATYLTPEIDTSEIIVDVQRHVPMSVQWHFQEIFTCQRYVPKDCHFPSGVLLDMFNGTVFQWNFFFQISGV